MRSVAKKSRKFLGQAFDVFGAAVAASAAVRNQRSPEKSDLDTLGIDYKAFKRVNY